MPAMAIAGINETYKEFHLAAAAQNLRRLARLTIGAPSDQARTAAFG